MLLSLLLIFQVSVYPDPKSTSNRLILSPGSTPFLALLIFTDALLSLKLTWLLAGFSQSAANDLVRQEVKSIAGYIPQGEGQPSSEQTPGSLLLQDNSNTMNGSTVTSCSCLTLQTHLHQVNRCTNKHLIADQVQGSVHPNNA